MMNCVLKREKQRTFLADIESDRGVTLFRGMVSDPHSFRFAVGCAMPLWQATPLNDVTTG